MLAETRRRTPSGSLFTEEGLAGVYLNELSPGLARQVAAAFGAYLSRQSTAPLGDVALAGDGRALTPELMAAASDGLRWTGLNVVDLGAATSASFTLALNHLGAAGGLLIGNARGEANTVGLKFWGAAGRPISAGSELQAIQALCERGVDRPTRSSGGLSRFQVEPFYLSGLADHFHALRPLRLVLDTGCRSLVGYFRRLAAAVACELVLCREAAEGPAGGALSLSERVKSERAHFGVAIDGDGEVCRFVDERGAEATAQAMLVVMAGFLLDRQPGATMVVEVQTSSATIERLSSAGAKVVRSESSRAAMDAAMREHQAIFGGDGSGRFWFGSQPPMPDGLKTLSLVLTILSQSDRPFSSVVKSMTVR
jgi:phosphomannomutase